MKTPKTTKLYLFLLLPLTVLLNQLSAGHAQTTEQFYSTGVYRTIIPMLSRITGLYPYSLAEIIIIILAGGILGSLIKLLRSLSKERQGKPRILRAAGLNLLAAVGVIYFCFIIMWGLNYNRTSIATITGLDVRPSSVVELKQLTQDLALEVSNLRSHVQEDSAGVMDVPGGYQTVLTRAYLGYEILAPSIPQLGGSYGRPKPVLLSKSMAYIGIWGVYFPYTAEANVNVAIPQPYLAFTTLHEMAHQRGFAREDEANYIAYLTCRTHPDVDFRYSGNLRALIYALRALTQADPALQKEIYDTLDRGVKRDLLALEEFNKSHEGPIETITLKVNDLYLKANNQKDGDRSYGRVVDLLLAGYRLKAK